MWNKLGGVAGNLRSTVTQFANDFVDRTEELSQQVTAGTEPSCVDGLQRLF